MAEGKGQQHDHDSLFELQDKIETHTEQLRRLHGQRGNIERGVRISHLAREELEKLPPGTRTFPALGRAFVFKTLQGSVDMLKEEEEGGLKEAEDTVKKMQYHERVLKNLSDQLEEIMGERQKAMAK